MKAAIFDMDGLLLDSEQYYARGWVEAGKIHGIPITWELILQNCGRETSYSRKCLKELFGQDFDYDFYRSESRRIVAGWLDGRPIPAKPYAREILASLKDAGYKLALATSTLRETALGQLEVLGLAAYFDETCCGGEAEHGKPAPDIFLLAAKKLGVEPGDCAVLEDSANGVLAARAAGMTALWIPDLITPDMRPDIAREASVIFPGLQEACEYLTVRYEA